MKLSSIVHNWIVHVDQFPDLILLPMRMNFPSLLGETMDDRDESHLSMRWMKFWEMKKKKIEEEDQSSVHWLMLVGKGDQRC